MLNIPNYYRRNANQNDNENIKSYQTGHPYKSTNNKCKLNLPSDIPTPGPVSQENHLSRSPVHPNVHFSTS